MTIHQLHNKPLPYEATLTISSTTLDLLLVPPGCVLTLLGDQTMNVTSVNASGAKLTTDDDGGTFPSSGVQQYSAAEMAAGPIRNAGSRAGKRNGKWYHAVGVSKDSTNVTLRVTVEWPAGQGA